MIYYKEKNIQSRPNIPVSNPTDSHYKQRGWIPYDRNVPDYDPATQKISKADIIIKNEVSVQQWNVTEKTEQEKQEYIESQKTSDDKLDEVRKEAKQRTESVVSKIADIIERKDFQKQGIGKEISDEIRNSNAKK